MSFVCRDVQYSSVSREIKLCAVLVGNITDVALHTTNQRCVVVCVRIYLAPRQQFA